MVTVYAIGAHKENVVEKQKQIIDLIKQNNKISARKISNLLGVSERTVQRYLDNLQKQKLISHIGPAKGGYWNIEK